MKSFKLVLGNDIKRLGSVPENYSQLLDKVKTVFPANLPKFYNLRYLDSDGD
jgi:hypothetical protein